MYNDGLDMAPWCYEYPNHPTTMAVTLRRRRGTDARGWEESGGCYLGPRTWFSTLGARCAQALADRLTDRLAMGWTNQRTDKRPDSDSEIGFRLAYPFFSGVGLVCGIFGSNRCGGGMLRQSGSGISYLPQSWASCLRRRGGGARVGLKKKKRKKPDRLVAVRRYARTRRQ